MSNAITRSHSGDRFYNPPAMRRQHQLVLQQQQHHHHQQLLQKQLQRPSHKQNRVDPDEVETRTDSDDSTFSKPSSARSISPPKHPNLTNLDRLIESVTPFVPAQYKMANRSAWKTREIDSLPFFCLGDLWESFKEWSVYGAGVPLLLNGGDSVKQYYVPSLSGIQLYVDPHTSRKHGEDSEADTSRETSSAGSSDCEAEKRGKGGADGAWGHHNLFNSNCQRLHGLTSREKPPKSSSSEETEIRYTPDLLLFEYLEQDQPHQRKPLYDMVSNLASRCPDLKLLRSCDLLPSSWVSVAWYPIYRIPMGPTLQNLDASFLTFHSLSTHSRSKNQQVHIDALSGRKGQGAVSPKIALPVFGLASYKLRGSILTQSGAQELQQSNSLLQAANNWLQRLQVNLPDFQFFASHNPKLR